MFKATHRVTGTRHKVYKVRYDEYGDTMFLIYTHEWEWVKCNIFIPIED